MSDVHQLQAQNTDLKSKIENLKKDYTRHIESLNREMTELKQKPSSEREYVDKITMLSEENYKLRNLLQSIQRDNNRNKNLNDDLKNNNDKAIDDMRQAIDMQQKNDMEQLKTDMQLQNKEKLRELENDNLALKYQIEDLREQQRMISEETDDMFEAQKQTNRELEDLKKKYYDLLARQERVNMFNRERERIIKQQVEKETQILSDDLNKALEKLQEERSKVRDKESDIEILKLKADDLRQEIKRIVQMHALNEAEKCQVEQDALKLRAIGLQQQILELKGKLSNSSIDKLKDVHEKEIYDLRRQKTNLQQMNKDLQKKIQELNSQNIKAITMENQIKDLQAQIDFYNMILPKLDEQLGSLKEEMLQMKEKELQYQRDLNQKDYQIVILKKEAFDKNQLQGKSDDLEYELERARKDREQFEQNHVKNLDQANKQIDDLLKQREDLMKQLSQAERGLGAGGDKFKQKCEELEKDIQILVEERKNFFSVQQYTLMLKERDRWKEKYYEVTKNLGKVPDGRATAY